MIGRPPKSSTASNVLLPANHTSTGHVTIAVSRPPSSHSASA